MRTLYLTLGLFILFNIGAACRTPSQSPAGCETFSAGLLHCVGDGGPRLE